MRLSRIELAASVSLRDAARSFLNMSPAVRSSCFSDSFVFKPLAGGTIDFLLECIDFAGELVLALAELLRLVLLRRPLLIQLVDVFLDLLLLARHGFGLAHRVGDVPPGARRLRLLELPFRLLQLLHRTRR